MTDSLDAPAPRLLFILNNDYGELGLAMYFLQGRGLTNSTTLLLPPRLFSKNRDTLPGTVLEYQCIEDITRSVDEIEPDIVFLFSGYILPLHEIISLDAMDTLVKSLVERNCKVVTSDPFFGIFAKLDPADVTPQKALAMFQAEIISNQSWPYRISTTFGNIRILKKFTAASDIIKDTTHLYYTLPDPADEAIDTETENVSFFNPSLVVDQQKSGEAAVAGSDTRNADGQHWLFILGSVDYELQASFYGEDRFIDILVQKVNETLQAGRRPVFLAPDECIQKMSRLAPVAARKGLMTFCAYEKFNTLLLTAEYVFYFNLASYSTFLRVINGLPMFMFDKGHLARHVKSMPKRMVQWYYQNWTPPFLNQHAALDVGVLQALSKGYRNDTSRILDNLKGLPTPEQLIQQLLHPRADFTGDSHATLETI